MLVIPALDLLAGRVVRLEQGRAERATVYSDQPAAVARAFAAQGAQRLHVVDLDGAFAGGAASANRAAVAGICAAVGPRVSVQVGGGVRDLLACETLLGQVGAAAVVLGTAAVKSPELVRAACARWPGRVVVAVDARAGRVAVEGWAQETDLDAAALAAQVVAAGAAAVLYTDIERDGLKSGPALEATAELARALAPVPVIASGGVASLDDLRALAAAGVPLCVVGRALYDGSFTLPEAITPARQ